MEVLIHSFNPIPQPDLFKDGFRSYSPVVNLKRIIMKRQDQYKRKMEFIAENIYHLPEAVREDEFQRDALYYRLQISIDATMDLVAMICKDFGITVKDDYANIEALGDKDIIPPNLATSLRRMNGLRNVLVHHYNKIELEMVLQEKENAVKILAQFMEIVEEKVHERFDQPAAD